MPVAQPLRQAASVVMPCSLPKTSAIVHSCVWTSFGGAPPICAAACALAPLKSDSKHAATTATSTVATIRKALQGSELSDHNKRSHPPARHPGRNACAAEEKTAAEKLQWEATFIAVLARCTLKTNTLTQSQRSAGGYCIL